MIKKFKLNPRYPHHRSEGLTWRRNSGSILQERANGRKVAAHKFEHTNQSESHMTENLPVNWQEQMAQEAKAVARAFRPVTGQISTKSGIMSYMDRPLPGNKIECIILAAIFENNLFDGKFDPRNPRNPVCYAFGQTMPDGGKPEMVPHTEVQSPIAPTCRECPNSQWGSDEDSPSGKGKKCKEIYKLGLVPVTSAMDDSVKAEMAILRVPVTSRKNFEVFVNTAAGSLQRPSWGVIAEISLVPDQRTQFQMKFAVKEAVPEDYLGNIYPRITGAYEALMQKYEENKDKPEAEAPAKAGKRKY